jgi:SAM-dependent methyltransferase
MDLGGSLPFDNGEFDVVLASHVLEHIEAPHPALREFQRVLRPGGRLVLIVPNAEGYSGGYAPYHMNYYSPTTVLQSVRVAGFTPQLITTDMPLAGTLDSRWRIRTPLLPGNLARRWQRRILRFLPAYHAGGNLYCVADKRQPGSPIASGRKT